MNKQLHSKIANLQVELKLKDEQLAAKNAVMLNMQMNMSGKQNVLTDQQNQTAKLHNTIRQLEGENQQLKANQDVMAAANKSNKQEIEVFKYLLL